MDDRERMKRQEAIDDLSGTCGSLENVLAELDREDLLDTQDFLQMLDEQIFCCSVCSWWCEQSEAVETDSGEDACRDCVPDDEIDF